MAVKASVVVPVKNGGPLLVRVLRQVQAQQTPWPFDILVIDSGSKDGSRERVRELGVPLHRIAPGEFGHGKTRNLGARLTTGEFIVFITQDALPTGRGWLAELIAAAELSPDTAGAFGRHLAYPEASPATERELAAHFQGFGAVPNTVRLDDPARYRNEEGYRQFLHFFSSNNACIRRTVWREIPLPEVDFAEDQLWAKAVIEAGYAKAYAPQACVYHSHNFGVLESYRRAFDESRALRRQFGYRLVPSLRHLLIHGWRLTRRDLGWVRAAALGRRAKLGWALRTPWLNLARLGGYYLGAKQGSLPVWLHDIISRDKALQRS